MFLSLYFPRMTPTTFLLVLAIGLITISDVTPEARGTPRVTRYDRVPFDSRAGSLWPCANGAGPERCLSLRQLLRNLAAAGAEEIRLAGARERSDDGDRQPRARRQGDVARPQGQRQGGALRARRDSAHAHPATLLFRRRRHRGQLSDFPLSVAERAGSLPRRHHDEQRAYVTCGERELRFGMRWSVEYSLGAGRRVPHRARGHPQSRPAAAPLDVMVECRAAVGAGHAYDFPNGAVLSHASRIATIDWKTQGPKRRGRYQGDDRLFLEVERRECVRRVHAVARDGPVSRRGRARGAGHQAVELWRRPGSRLGDAEHCRTPAVHRDSGRADRRSIDQVRAPTL